VVILDTQQNSGLVCITALALALSVEQCDDGLTGQAAFPRPLRDVDSAPFKLGPNLLSGFDIPHGYLCRKMYKCEAERTIKIHETCIIVKGLCMESTEKFDSVLGRLKEAAGLDRDSDIAKLLGMSPQALNNRKKTGSIPATEIVDACNQRGIDLNYVFRGEGRAESDALRAAIAEIQTWQVREQRFLSPDKFVETVFVLADIAEGEPSRVKSAAAKVLRLVA